MKKIDEIKYSKHVITPKGRKCFPTKVFSCQNVLRAENLLVNDSSSAIFNTANGKSYIVLDMGGASPGGYPVFIVENFTENATINVSYSDRLEGFESDDGRRIGDFKRGTCTYLGVGLPVLPANPGRYEQYTITRKGEYLFPLIQGQQRFVAIELISKNSEVQISNFYIHYTSDLTEYYGGFKCSNEKMEKLWYASAYTNQIATISASQWDTLCGKLLLRALTKSSGIGLIKGSEYLKNYNVNCDFFISHNSYASSGIGFCFRAKNRENGYAINIDLDGSVTFYKIIDSVVNFVDRQIIKPLTDNKIYNAVLKVCGDTFSLQLDGNILQFSDSTFTSGGCGFYQDKEKWAAVSFLQVENQGEKIYDCDNFTDLNDFDITVTAPFISDGAKRDRLPWSGDIDWAFRSAYYAFGAHTKMAETLKLFDFNCTPDGFIHATAYPENNCRPHIYNYGDYESDMFSGWYIVSAYTYYLYTKDDETIKKIYPSISQGLKYFLRFIESDGLFNQRYDTSKGLWDHNLGDIGKHSYSNLIIYRAFSGGAHLAAASLNQTDAQLFADTANRMKEAINKELWREDIGGFIQSKGRNVFCDQANAYAMSIGFVTKVQADLIALNADKTRGYGKILTLMINGLYDYGYQEKAFAFLTGKFRLKDTQTDVNWLDMVDTEFYPNTLTECMHFPPMFFGQGNNWGDMSHPDSGICDILSGKILGVTPINNGFEYVALCPNPYGIESIEGIVPTRYGDIWVKYDITDKECRLEYKCPSEIKLKIDLSRIKVKTILVNKTENDKYEKESDGGNTGNVSVCGGVCRL